MSYYYYKRKSDPINWEWGISRPNNGGWWWNVSQNINLTQDDVRMNRDQINWYALSGNRKFPFDDEFLAEFEDLIDWHEYVNTHKISEATYLKFQKHIKLFDFLSHNGEKKMEMFKKYFHLVDKKKNENWYHEPISDRLNLIRFVTLPEKFLGEVAEDEDDWYTIARYQKLSENFIRKHREHLKTADLISSYHLSKELKEKIETGLL